MNAIFAKYNETLGRTIEMSEKEAEALATVTDRMIQQTQDAEALSHIQEVLTKRTDAHNAAIVNPAVSDVVESFREYSNIIGEVNLGYDEIIPITQDFTDGLLRQASAFDELRRSVERFNKTESKRREQRGIPTPDLPAEMIDPNDSLDLIDFHINRTNEFGEEIDLTAKELKKLREQEFAGLGDAIFDVIDIVNNLDAKNFGVSDTNAKAIGTFGKLAGAVASGNPAALLAAPFEIYNDMMNEHHENVRKIFADERKRTEEGIEEEQRDLDAYAKIRKHLYAARMDFLTHGKSTFEDWTDTLQSFANNDLVKSKEVFAEFTEAMNEVNQKVGGASKALGTVVTDPGAAKAASLRYNTRQRIENTPGFTPTRGSLPTDQESEALLRGVDPQELGLTAEQVRNVDDKALDAALQANQESIDAINTAIAGLNESISQSNDPEEIAALLQQIAVQISEKYRQIREALEQQLDAGKISVDVYNTRLSELSTGESSELERNSDEMLANVVRMIDEDIQLIDASITDINTQIAGLSDPEAIVALLELIPGLITDKYTGLREALDAKYAAKEISVDVYNASLSLPVKS